MIFQERSRLLKILAKYDIDRLQLFPMTEATRSSKGGKQLLVAKEDRALVKEELKFLYFDSASVLFSYESGNDEENVSITPANRRGQRFTAQAGADPTRSSHRRSTFRSRRSRRQTSRPRTGPDHQRRSF